MSCNKRSANSMNTWLINHDKTNDRKAHIVGYVVHKFEQINQNVKTFLIRRRIR